MGLFSFLFESKEDRDKREEKETKQRMTRQALHRGVHTAGMFDGLYDHWPGMSIPHPDTTTPRYAKRIAGDSPEEARLVTKCSECPFSARVWVGISRPCQQDCHHPELVPWNCSFGRGYLFPLSYESFPDWCPLLICKTPRFDTDMNYIRSDGTKLPPAGKF